MDLGDGYRLQVQEYKGHKFIAIRKFFRHGSSQAPKPGVPGFNINAYQWDKLKQLKRSLVKAALSNEKKVVQLGFDKFIEVKQGVIWLTRIPEDCCEEFMRRNTVPLRPRLWQKIWQSASWIDKELQDKVAETKYELDSSEGDPQEQQKQEADVTEPVAEDRQEQEEEEEEAEADNEATDSLADGLKMDCEEPLAASTPLAPAASTQIPRQDTDLREDPVWYQFRAHAVEARRRKNPFPLRRQEALKLPKLSFE